MPRKKFIDKKNATTYYIIPGNDADKAEKPPQKADYRKEDWELGEYGFESDGYNYLQHFKPIGTGVWFQAAPTSAAPVVFAPGDEKKPIEERQSNPAVGFDPDVDPSLIPKDVDEIFVKEEVAPDEELEDDFVLTANGGELPVLSKKLASKKKAPQVSRTESDEEDDLDFDSAVEDDEEDPDGLPALEPVARRSKPKMPAATPHTNTVFDDQFEQVAKAYDEENIGELDADDPRARGNLTLDSFADVLDEFLESRQMRTLLAPDQKVGLLSAKPTTQKRTTLPPAAPAKSLAKMSLSERLDGDDEGEEFDEDEDEEGAHDHYSDIDDDDDDTDTPDDRKAVAALTLELVAAQGKAASPNDNEAGSDEEEYEVVKIKTGLAFDCESMISTYSNTENHPALIAEPGRRRTAAKSSASAIEKIELSKKTGLPLGVLPAKERKEKPFAEAVPNAGAARKRGETPEERAARKAAVKEQKRAGRERKKALKIAFKTEEALQLRVTTGQPTLGKSVVHF